MPKLNAADAKRVEEMPPMLMWAMVWSQKFGIPVLPCREVNTAPEGKSNVKAPYISGGKDSATTDVETIRQWWSQWPDALIGGSASNGLVVLDFDAYKAGHATDVDELGALPPTRTFRTPGRDGVPGKHLVYRDPTGQLRSTKFGTHSTIDIRGGASQDYVILPPSRSPAGVYEVASWLPPALAPPWLLEYRRSDTVNAEDLPDELPPLERVPWWIAVDETGIEDDPEKRSEHTYRLIRNGRKAGLTPGEARQLAEDDETTTARLGEQKRSGPGWWCGEFWRCWHQAADELAKKGIRPRRPPEPQPSLPDGPPAIDRSTGGGNGMEDDEDGISGTVVPAIALCPLLPEDFWDTPTHPFLAHIRQAALYKMCSPDAVLHAVLINVATLTHYKWLLPDLGSPGTLDLLAGIVANPGDGKGTAVTTGNALVQLDLYLETTGDDDKRIRTRPMGSGEGMAATFFEWVEEEDANGKVKARYKRYAIAVRFESAEGAEYKNLSDRSGQTTGALVRKMFFGQYIGHSYVGQSKDAQLPDRQYRATLILQLQPKTVAAIIAEVGEGTPQRLLYSSPKDYRLPESIDDLPDEWPGPLDWKPSPVDLRLNPAGDPHPPVIIKVRKEIIREVRQALLDHSRAVLPGDDMNAHRNMLRLKVAALLGCLRTGTPIVDFSDWELSGQVLATSYAVLAWASARLGDIKELQRQAGIDLSTDKARAAELATAEVRDGTLLVAQRIQRHLAKHAEGVPTRTLRDSARGPAGRDRQFWSAALKRAQAEGWAEQKDDGLWYPLGDAGDA